MKPIAIDAFDFGRVRDQRDGTVPVADLPRLLRECVDSSGILKWSLAGGMHDSGHPQLSITVDGSVQLVCQRCLQPFEYPIASRSVLVLTQDDAHADQVEAMLDDDSLDVIVGSTTLNLYDLIEDEALLALPQAPKHVHCPRQSIPVVSEAASGRPSPFAVLKNLKH